MPNQKSTTKKTPAPNGGETHQQAPANGAALTTNQGVPLSDNQNSLKGGGRGPTLLEDFILREKITHFDHERIPERIVHARGSAAHGYFQPYQSMAHVTSAAFLADPSVKTPGVRAILHRRRWRWFSRPPAGRARFCREVLYPAGKF